MHPAITGEPAQQAAVVEAPHEVGAVPGERHALDVGAELAVRRRRARPGMVKRATAAHGGNEFACVAKGRVFDVDAGAQRGRAVWN